MDPLPIRHARTTTLITANLLIRALSANAYPQCELGWRGLEPYPGVNAMPFAMTTWDDGSGPALYFGGYFEVAGDRVVNRVAKWDGDRIHALGSGISGSAGGSPIVTAIAPFRDELVVGGRFAMAGGVPASRIASWNGTRWNALAEGITAPTYATVICMTEFESDLIVGGSFGMAGQTAVNNIARWDGLQWHALGDGLPTVTSDFSAPANALVVFQGELIVGGAFLQPGQAAQSLIRWDGQQWLAFPEWSPDPYSAVTALHVRGSTLLVGGAFRMAGGAIRDLARWNGEWTPLGNGGGLYFWNDDPQGRPYQFADAGDEIVMCGYFSQVDGSGASGVARFDGAQWHGYGTQIYPYDMNCCANFQDEVYLGGYFDRIYQDGEWVNQRFLARRIGSRWERLDPSASELIPVAAGVFQGALVLGGEFRLSDGARENSVIRQTPGGWEWLGSTVGIVAGFQEFRGTLVAFGDPWNAANPLREHVVVFDGTDWVSLGGGTNGTVTCATLFENDLVIGGAFMGAGGLNTNRVARWDGAGWRSFGSGLTYSATALNVHQGVLYASGSGGVHRWNGETWVAVGTNAPRSVLDFQSYDGKLYAGGAFTGGVVAWDGQTWSQPDGGIPDVTTRVESLAVHRGLLIVAGNFTFADGTSSYIAAWSEAAGWQSLDGGFYPDYEFVTESVNDVITLGPHLIAAGSLYRAGDVVTSNAGRWGPTCIGDFDGSGDIDIADLAVVLSSFGAAADCDQGDADGDQRVTLQDLTLVLAALGSNCE